jgi:hypothetical protein
MRSALPQPPNPDDISYRADARKFARAQYDWMCRVKGYLEDTARRIDRPIAQQFVVGSFTTNTTISGTDTLGDVADCLASLITAMISKGLISQTVSRTNG